MNSVTLRGKFDPLDLEMLDRVYALACFYIEAGNLCRNATEEMAIEKEALRKQIFVLADSGPVKFDLLCDKLLVVVEEHKTVSRAA